jgi:hypothetical protein
MTFERGQKVKKVGGGYQATGTIVSCFYTLAGDERCVFEFDIYPGMLHIFSPKQMEKLEYDHLKT